MRIFELSDNINSMVDSPRPFLTRYRFVILLAIIAVGGFLRFYALASTPSGIHPDEAINGLNALQALDQANFQVFYQDNNGREGLYVNLVALLVQIVGPTVWSVRAVSAFAGTITLFGIAFLAYEIGLLFAKEFFRKNKELYASTLMIATTLLISLSAWHIHFSRIGFRAILFPLLASFTVAYLLRGLRRKSASDMGLSGVALGLSLATYIASRIFPVVIAIFMGFVMFTNRSRRLLLNTGILVAAFVLSVLPLIGYFIENPADLATRSAGVSIFTQDAPLEALAAGVGKALGMFNVSGNQNFIYGVVGAPLLTPVMGLLFLMGIFILFARLKHSKTAWFLLGWTGVMLLPVALATDGAPSALLALGALVPVMLITGLGSIHIWDFVKTRFSFYVRISILGFVVAAMVLFNVNRYFFTWTESRTEIDNVFRADLVRASEYLNDRIEYRSARYKDALSSEPKDIETIDTISALRDYVVINEPDNSFIDGVPMPITIIRYLTSDSPDLVFMPENRIRDIKPIIGETNILLINPPGTELAATIRKVFPSANMTEYDGFVVYEL